MRQSWRRVWRTMIVGEREAEHKSRSEDTAYRLARLGTQENSRVLSKASQMFVLSMPCHKLPQS